MTNHVHFIAVPQSETALTRAFGEAHRRYTRMKNFEEGVRGYLFQGRFSSVVLDERHLMAAARYVERNPVRASMVGHAWEYPWSSAAFHADLRAFDPLVKEKTLPTLVGNWLEFLSGSDEKEMDALRMATRRGRPAGDEAFLIERSKITGKKVMRGRPGRPRKKAGTEKNGIMVLCPRISRSIDHREYRSSQNSVHARLPDHACYGSRLGALSAWIIPNQSTALIEMERRTMPGVRGKKKPGGHITTRFYTTLFLK